MAAVGRCDARKLVLERGLRWPRAPGCNIFGSGDGRGMRARRLPNGAGAPCGAEPLLRTAHSMAKQDAIELEGTVAEVLPNATFRVETKSGHQVLATLAGNMRRFRIRVLAGDRVTLEVSPYDLTRGRITFRHKS